MLDSSVNTLDARSHLASLLWTSTRICTLPVVGQFDLAHAPDRKAGERHVHAGNDAFGIVGHEHQALGRLEHAARVHHVEHEAADHQAASNTSRITALVSTWLRLVGKRAIGNLVRHVNVGPVNQMYFRQAKPLRSRAARTAGAARPAARSRPDGAGSAAFRGWRRSESRATARPNSTVLSTKPVVTVGVEHAPHRARVVAQAPRRHAVDVQVGQQQHDRWTLTMRQASAPTTHWRSTAAPGRCACGAAHRRWRHAQAARDAQGRGPTRRTPCRRAARRTAPRDSGISSSTSTRTTISSAKPDRP